MFSIVMNNPASSESPDLQLPVPQPLEIISIPGPSSSNPDTFRDAGKYIHIQINIH
jgi:hypothetical protein